MDAVIARQKGRLMAEVFLLYHISHALRDEAAPRHLGEDGDPLCDEQAGDDVKLLGAYSSDAAAGARIESARTLPGFSDEPGCFQVVSYTLDKDEWTEGFMIVG
jgi:hypothetical protein